MSTHPFTHRVNVPLLRRRMFGNSKIPKDASIERIVQDVPMQYAEDKIMSLTVHPHIERKDKYGRIKSSKHRIFVLCSCGREIPIGRVTQHTHKE
jgi:hypothetical protein